MSTHAERLGPNTFQTFYPGDGRISAFRHASGVPATHAEDWVGSVSTRAGQPALGLSRLSDGSLLTERIAADPVGWVGRTSVDEVSDAAAVLVKLLDAGARLPLHIHPDRDFAATHLGSRHGKNEAWLVLHAESDATAHLGFARDVTADELQRWVEAQDVAALLDACHQVPVRTGDVIFCPGGVPHAIGADVFLVEVQEPTDFSIMLEWEGHPLDPADSFLGLDAALALGAVRRDGLADADLAALRGESLVALTDGSAGLTSLLPPEVAELFTAEQVVDHGTGVELPRGFSVLVVNEGSGELHSESADPLEVAAGDTLVLPHALAAPTLRGELSAIRCAPGLLG